LSKEEAKVEVDAAHRYVARVPAKAAAADKWSRDFAPPTEHRQRPKTATGARHFAEVEQFQ
jgi:hypothetical protein